LLSETIALPFQVFQFRFGLFRQRRIPGLDLLETAQNALVDSLRHALDPLPAVCFEFFGCSRQFLVCQLRESDGIADKHPLLSFREQIAAHASASRFIDGNAYESSQPVRGEHITG
jgi:hypothetical protein